MEAASTQAWVNAAKTWVRVGEEPAWLQMRAGMVAATTAFVPSQEGERGQGGREDVMDLVREVVVIGDDTPPRTDVVERTGADGGGGDAVFEETSRTTPDGAPQALMSEAPLVVEPQATPATEPAMVPERVPAAREAASGEHALVPRPRACYLLSTALVFP